LDEENEQEDNDLVEYATRPPTAVGTGAGSTAGELAGTDDQEETHTNEEGSEGDAEVDAEEDEGEGEEEKDEEEGEDEDEEDDDDAAEDNASGAADSEQFEAQVTYRANTTTGKKPKTAHEREVDARLSRLEGNMKELKGLMLRILGRLEE
jgi:hypothetical protein